MLLLITFLLVAIGFSFYCSIAEAVLLSVNKPYINLLVQEGKRSGKLLYELKQNINRPLSAILTLNTIAHTVGAAGVGAQATRLWGDGSLGIVSGVLTFLILVFSEIIPKTLGAHYWRQLAHFIAYTIYPLMWLLKPFVFLSEKLTSSITHGNATESFTRDELAALADIGEKEGQLEEQESRILRNLFSLKKTEIQDIMTPRSVVFQLSDQMSVVAYFNQHDGIRFSRIPIYHEELDNITGFVLRSDLLLAQARGNEKVLLSNYKREISALNKETNVLDAYEHLLETRGQVMIAIDDFGSMVGLITLEDILESLLGLEIIDEGDAIPDMQKLAHQLWRRRAKKMGVDIDSYKEQL